MSNKQIQRSVSKIISQVRRNGDRALIQFTKRFDQVKLSVRSLKVSPDQIKKAVKNCDPKLKRSISACAVRIKRFHLQEKKNIQSSWSFNQSGSRLGQVLRPLDSVGLYVPGGRFSYPSTVLMTAIPAQVAGVKRIAMLTPPGRLSDKILFAANLVGVKEIYQVGGPAAIAALALGTRRIPKVDFISGPGNVWVTEAKRQLFGDVGIDLLAGPSELVVLADAKASAQFIAADMLAQAEHDPYSQSYLVTGSRHKIREVRKLIPQKYGRQCKLIFKSRLNDAIDTVNALAAEHVEVLMTRPQKVMNKLKNAGTMFIGPWSPTVMGDYWAGPSHVLPTGRSARFASGLSVTTFMKRIGVVQISKAAYRKGWKDAYRVALSEGLVNHAQSLKVRMEK